MATAPRRPMSRRALHRLLREAGMTRQDIADELETDVRTVRRYLSGDAIIPRRFEYATRWAVQERLKSP